MAAAGILLLIAPIIFYTILVYNYYGTTCTSEMNLESGTYRNGRIYNRNGKRVCTPIDDEVSSYPVKSPDGQHIAFISNFSWENNEMSAFSAVFVANADGSDLRIIDPFNEITQRRHVWYVGWVNSQTIALDYASLEFKCTYHIDGTFIGCDN